MSKPEWGIKRLCHACNVLYYDMQKSPATCPKCNAAFDPEALLKSRRRVTADDTKKKPATVEETVDDIEIDDVVVEDDAVADDDLADDGEVDLDVDVEDEK